ncbi:hypothetical protein MRX96_020476 [Rhipicephalus microplus]
MDRAKLPCLFLVQFLGFWCLQFSEPPGVHLACPAAVDTLGLPFTSRLSMWKANEAAAADPEKPRVPSSTQPLHSHWPYLVTSWRYRTYLEAGTSSTAHAFNLDIKPARIVAALSGLGSTAMDRAKLPCLFLVQFLGFWCLQFSEPPGVHLACPAVVDTLGLPFTSRLSMWKADEAAAADPEKPRAPSSTQPLHSHWPYLGGEKRRPEPDRPLLLQLPGAAEPCAALGPMFLHTAMRYYRLWIYTCNVALLLSALAFSVAAAWVLSDYRASLVPGLRLADPTFVYAVPALLLQGGLLQASHVRVLSTLCPPIP